VAAAERQMQTWVRTQELKDRALISQRRSKQQQTLTYVAISRESGAGGGEIARLVGEQLGWEVLDKNLLDQIAERFHESRTMLDLVDETSVNWVYDVLGTWMDRRIVPHEKFVSQLSRVVLAMTRHGSAVFVGRGAQFLLPRDKTLAVRIAASERYRLAQIMRRQALSEIQARRFLHETDQGRHEFVERFFRHDINDLHLYDLVINVEHLGPQGVADQILAALKA
jgi:cytidylate kinase